MDSYYPTSETSFVFTRDMNEELVKRFKRKNSGIKKTEDVTANSGTLKTKCYYPENIIGRHESIEEKVEKPENIGLRNG